MTTSERKPYLRRYDLHSGTRPDGAPVIMLDERGDGHWVLHSDLVALGFAVPPPPYLPLDPASLEQADHP